jgi:hypothetical protein
MLSPNAMNRVAARRGMLTFTEKPHVAVRVEASVATQTTDVVPALKAVPEAGEHATVTGDVPPVAVGAT